MKVIPSETCQILNVADLSAVRHNLSTVACYQLSLVRPSRPLVFTSRRPCQAAWRASSATAEVVKSDYDPSQTRYLSHATGSCG